MAGPHAALTVRGLSKAYPGVVALDDVSLSLSPGEVRAICGKNGAGKSTLVRILSGAVPPDCGTVLVEGRAARLDSPAAARDHGIATVHQELSLVPGLSVAENVLLGRWHPDGRPRLGVLSPRRMRRAACEAIAALDIDLDVEARVGELSPAQQQAVEIARALSFRPRVLILDEPTSSLPAHEVDVVLRIVRRLRSLGVATIYISHRMSEVRAIADSVTVLRDGRHVVTRLAPELDTGAIVELMGGAVRAERTHTRARAASRQVMLEVKGLSSPGRLHDVSFSVRAGEIVGLAGLLGAGRTELLRAIYGLDADATGEIRVAGGSARMRSRPAERIRRGVCFTPEDRRKDGFAPGLTVRDNVVMSALGKVSRGSVVSGRAERAMAGATVASLAIKTPSTDTAAGLLSGGNQQKMILGKCLNAGASLLLLDEPTRGVDVLARGEIHARLHELADRGTAIVATSSELDELFELCDRLLVLGAGRVLADVETADAQPREVMTMMMEGGIL
ncbi:MAG: ribose transport system ATP-binding protein [Solirubrobacteraceae bacterium]